MLEEGIRRIVDAGGVASLAHPVRVRSYERVIPQMACLGLGAIEVYHSDHDEEETRQFLEMARQLDLQITGGSDFHGTAKPSVKIGEPRIPKNILDMLRVPR
jgi:predicted metal-dependent phosphoesterase TrpH